jgi:hypothetical protein
MTNARVIRRELPTGEFTFTADCAGDDGELVLLLHGFPQTSHTWRHQLPALADSQGAQRFHVVGHDWGGQIAWLVAAWNPRRVASLTVLSRPHPAAFAAAIKQDEFQAGRSKHHRAFLAPDTAEGTASRVTGPYTFVELGGVNHFITDEKPQPVTDHLIGHVQEHTA